MQLAAMAAAMRLLCDSPCYTVARPPPARPLVDAALSALCRKIHHVAAATLGT